ncbi:MAG: sugar transferase [Bacteriovoracia bacterium]
MLKNRAEQIHVLVRSMDVVLCAAAFVTAYYLRDARIFDLGLGTLPAIESLTWMLGASVVIHFILYPAFGFYQSLRLKRISDIILMVMKAALAEVAILGSLIFILQAKTTSRYFFVLFLGLNYAFILVERLSARIALSSVRRRGYNYRRVLIAGTGVNARRVIESLHRNRHWGYLPSGLLREQSSPLPEGPGSLDGVPVVGTVADLEKLIHEIAVDEVYFALDRIDSDEVSRQVTLCETLGIPARFSLALFDLPASKVTFSTLDHLPIVTFYRNLMTPFEALIKRSTDIFISIIGLLITGAVLPWIAWRIRRESPGSVIFKQVRVGENGRRFKCYKFRTMYLDAEARKHELAGKNQMQGPIFKIDNDPRITPFGAFLRRTSLDELPQFFNILRGDMSVVGTRPPTPDEVSRYETHFRRRLSIRPGLTGLWQVSGRNQITRFEDILALDLQYIDRWSIWLDFQIIARTIWVTLFGRGAY